MDIPARTIETALRKPPERPAPFGSRDVGTGPDSNEDPAVRVWAMLKDDGVEFVKRSRLRSIISELVHVAARSSTLVCVRLRGASGVEQDR